MNVFAQLIQQLESTNKTTQKITAIEWFLAHASNEDKLWFLALFTGKRPKRSVATNLLKQWVLEQTKLPEWLFTECYAAVGDLGETIALLMPHESQSADKSLAEWMTEIIALKDQPEEVKKAYVLKSWSELNTTERFIFNKLLGGSFRLGVSSKTLINALAKYYNLEATAVTHAIMGDWDLHKVDFEQLVTGVYTATTKSQPYPFCLAYPLDKELQQLGNRLLWQVEYKWDGIRAQLIKRDDEVFLWSRGEELINHQFPEIILKAEELPFDFVVDGELLVVKDKKVYDFSHLQKRLNRKTITKKMLTELPVALCVYDLLEWNGTDIREQSLSERRGMLETYFSDFISEQFYFSEIISGSKWDGLDELRQNARQQNSEGLMLKNTLAPYRAGRKRGDWWKWKIDPLTIDAVLIYAQKGSGRRSGYYTDYTFAVKKDDKLVTIAKAYSGLTDKEIQEVSKFVTKNAIEKFGPVRTVKPELVFEIAFEGIAYSNRHKSGVALRFPRILRWRKDKTVNEIDTIEQVKKLIR